MANKRAEIYNYIFGPITEQDGKNPPMRELQLAKTVNFLDKSQPIHV